MKNWILILIISFWTSIIESKAQMNVPAPVDLQIQNIPQQNGMWCWAAVAQQIIFRIRGNAPPQCQLVASAKGGDPTICCSGPQFCDAPGSLLDIQNLILFYGGHFSNIAPPAHPEILYQTLSQGRPIILYLQTSPTIGHFIVLRGMAWVNTPFGLRPIVYVNDPMAIYTQPIPFSNLVNIWAAAIVVN